MNEHDLDRIAQDDAAMEAAWARLESESREIDQGAIPSYLYDDELDDEDLDDILFM